MNFPPKGIYLEKGEEKYNGNEMEKERESQDNELFQISKEVIFSS